MTLNRPFSTRVLLAVDDVRLRRSFETGLRHNGLAVSVPGDGAAARLLAKSFAADVVIADSEMSVENDVPLYSHVSEELDCYLLCLDVHGHERHRIELLRAGADDAVSIPVSSAELAARCEALLRRPRDGRVDWDIPTQNIVSLGPLVVDSSRHELRFNEVGISATRIEFALLAHLTRNPGSVATRHELLETVWGPHWVGDTHVVDVHLSNLRRKLEEAMPGMPVIHTVRGVGFRISNEILDASLATAQAASFDGSSGDDFDIDAAAAC